MLLKTKFQTMEVQFHSLSKNKKPSFQNMLMLFICLLKKHFEFAKITETEDKIYCGFTKLR